LRKNSNCGGQKKKEKKNISPIFHPQFSLAAAAAGPISPEP
jgi:hypothetical protein